MSQYTTDVTIQLSLYLWRRNNRHSTPHTSQYNKIQLDYNYVVGSSNLGRLALTLTSKSTLEQIAVYSVKSDIVKLRELEDNVPGEPDTLECAQYENARRLN